MDLLTFGQALHANPLDDASPWLVIDTGDFSRENQARAERADYEGYPTVLLIDLPERLTKDANNVPVNAEAFPDVVIEGPKKAHVDALFNHFVAALKRQEVDEMAPGISLNAPPEVMPGRVTPTRMQSGEFLAVLPLKLIYSY